MAREALGTDVEIRNHLGTHAHFRETTAERGTPSRHAVTVVDEATPIEPNPTITLDDQHDDYRFLTEPDPDLHEYVRRYVADGDLLA